MEDHPEVTLNDLLTGLFCCFYLRGIRKVEVSMGFEEAVVDTGRETLALLAAQGVENFIVLNVNPLYGGCGAVRGALREPGMSIFFKNMGSKIWRLDLSESLAEEILTSLPGARETYERFTRRMLEELKY